MRYSKQKEEVLKVVLESFDHPDAQKVYKTVKKRIPNISLGTVYRNLNTLSDEKLIRRVRNQDGNDRYDRTLTNHNHVKCERCGKVCDISILIDDSKVSMIEKETGFKITDCNFNINGICEDCMKGN